MRNVPELRFAGFEGEWEEKKFGKVIERKSKSSSNNSLPRVEYEDIIPEIGKLNKDINSKSSIKKGIYFESDDVLFGKLRPYLKNYLNPQFEGIAVGDFWILNNKSGDNSFLFYYIQIPQFQYIANTSIGTKMPRSDWNLVSGSKFIYPSNNEQEKIGDLFKDIDDLIEIQEGKVSKMRDYKKSMLQKMFPKKDELVPEFRFYGFDGQWEEKIVGDLLDYEQPTKYIVSSEEYYETGIPVLTANKSFILGYTDEKNIYNKGEVVLFDDFTQDMKYVNFPFMVKSSALKILTEKNSNLFFMFNLLSNINLINEGHKRHYISVVQNTNVVIPSLEEQQKIGQFFKNLDTQIENEEKLLDSYKMMKKSLLQKMFV